MTTPSFVRGWTVAVLAIAALSLSTVAAGAQGEPGAPPSPMRQAAQLDRDGQTAQARRHEDSDQRERRGEEQAERNQHQRQVRRPKSEMKNERAVNWRKKSVPILRSPLEIHVTTIDVRVEPRQRLGDIKYVVVDDPGVRAGQQKNGSNDREPREASKYLIASERRFLPCR